QTAGPFGDQSVESRRRSSGSFAHPRAVAAAPQRVGPDVCRIHDRLSGPWLDIGGLPLAPS
ncbi:MAG: hypothetical protein OXC83_00005, partial [Chloroflexi bacterium]|nr:hypothetical protein [Chloroflexota bacterium]